MIAATSLLSEAVVSPERAAILLDTPLINVNRWIKYGLKGVKLESTRNGIGVVTSVEAIGRFLVKVGVKAL